ncbi:hypothetical protein NDU88_007317 [Pleurodeles waltl]|uniref:Uncharacterized protein n=1 Tax=Pleurodeles waltl TaxID=8319 RepID=A0AAV7RQK5_PLEWA|nr:hypothetical protein NDU88_007317 [Pleurodeles waltl]
MHPLSYTEKRVFCTPPFLRWTFYPAGILCQQPVFTVIKMQLVKSLELHKVYKKAALNHKALLFLDSIILTSTAATAVMDSNKHEGKSENVPVINVQSQICQLQALASELKSGFTEAMQELSRIQHGEYELEEKVKSFRCAMEEKVMEVKNSLKYLKEEVSSAMAMIHAITAKQEEMQQKIEQLQQEKRRESRKVKAKRTQKEEYGSHTVPLLQQSNPQQTSNVADPILINQHFTQLLQTTGFEKAGGSIPLDASSCKTLKSNEYCSIRCEVVPMEVGAAFIGLSSIGELNANSKVIMEMLISTTATITLCSFFERITIVSPESDLKGEQLNAK